MKWPHRGGALLPIQPPGTRYCLLPPSHSSPLRSQGVRACVSLGTSTVFRAFPPNLPGTPHPGQLCPPEPHPSPLKGHIPLNLRTSSPSPDWSHTHQSICHPCQLDTFLPQSFILPICPGGAALPPDHLGGPSGAWHISLRAQPHPRPLLPQAHIYLGNAYSLLRQFIQASPTHSKVQASLG